MTCSPERDRDLLLIAPLKISGSAAEPFACRCIISEDLPNKASRYAGMGSFAVHKAAGQAISPNHPVVSVFSNQ